LLASSEKGEFTEKNGYGCRVIERSLDKLLRYDESGFPGIKRKPGGLNAGFQKPKDHAEVT
jgi:hypothetical protein